jgi:nucleotide-binding universal stress UspA family protein
LTALRIASPGGPPGSAKDGSALAEELDRLRSEAGAWAGIAVESVTVQAASIAESIDDFASKHKADLIVMGTQGLGQGPEPRLGSVADAMVRRTNIPVLLVPPAVWRMHSGAR